MSNIKFNASDVQRLFDYFDNKVTIEGTASSEEYQLYRKCGKALYGNEFEPVGVDPNIDYNV